MTSLEFTLRHYIHIYVLLYYIYFSIIYHKYNYHSLGGGWQLCCFYLFLGEMIRVVFTQTTR